MTPFFKHKHVRLLAHFALLACLVVVCIALTRTAQAAYLDFKVKSMTAEMKHLKTKPICVGRFLIDVPADAEVSFRGAAVAGWSIATYDDETDDQFAARIKEKEAALRGKKNALGMSSLESAYHVDKNGVRGKIHVFGRARMHAAPGEKPEEYIQIEATIRAQTHSFNLTIEFASDNDLNELTQLVTQFRSRKVDEVPTEAGYCFDGGFIVDPLPFKPGERTTMFVGLARHPDVSIMLDMTAGITTPKTLLQRDTESAIGDPNRSRFHTFRRGPRPSNGELGEEVLERVHEFNGNYGHSFMWELIHNKTDSVFTPLMSLEMTTGNGQPGTTVNSSLTDAEALVLWDKMLSSLRVRPVVTSKPVAAVPVQIPLGTLAHSNERCPQTGWWECTDGDKDTRILGGRTRYFRKGEGMAQAVQLMRTTLWQRITGQQPTYTPPEIPTPWKLVSRRDSSRGAPTAALVQPSPMPLDDRAGDSALLPEAQHDESALLPGTMADSGMECPASGWWRCVDVRTLDGTRWFGRGQTLPLATVKPSPSALARFKGTLELTNQKASWQFVRHDAGATVTMSQPLAADVDADKPG